MRVNADSLLIRAAATSTSGTLNDLTTDLIMANNNNIYRIETQCNVILTKEPQRAPRDLTFRVSTIPILITTPITFQLSLTIIIIGLCSVMARLAIHNTPQRS